MENVDKIKSKETNSESPFITKNVWIKRIGLLLLIVSLFPDLFFEYSNEFNEVFKYLLIFAGITYGIKLLKYFLSSIWNS